jgi:hypothetical protein
LAVVWESGRVRIGQERTACRGRCARFWWLKQRWD